MRPIPSLLRATALLALGSLPAAAGVWIEPTIEYEQLHASDAVRLRWLEGSRYEVSETFYGRLHQGERLTLDIPLRRSHDCNLEENEEAMRRSRARAEAAGRVRPRPPTPAQFDAVLSATPAAAPLEQLPDGGPAPHYDMDRGCFVPFDQPLRPGLEVLVYLARFPELERVNAVFWSDSPEAWTRQRGEALAAAARRREWDGALATRDPAARFEALWPWRNVSWYGAEAMTQPEAMGSFAGARIGERWPGLDEKEQAEWMARAGDYKIEALRPRLWKQVAETQASYERWAKAHASLLAAWKPYERSTDRNLADPPPPDEWRAAFQALHRDLASLSGYNDPADLPRFRACALWLARYRFPEVDSIFSAFAAHPAPENLPAIRAFVDAAGRDQWSRWRTNKEVSVATLFQVLRNHPYPDSVLILAPYIGTPEPGYSDEIHTWLTRLVGSDLGPLPGPWLEWARAQSPDH